MRLSRPVAILVGFLTLLPLVYMVYFFVTIASTFVQASPGAHADSGAFGRSFQLLMALHLSAMLLTFLLLAFYIVHVFKCPAFTDNRRVLWALVIFFGSFVGMGVYWYLNIWREPAPSVPPLQPSVPPSPITPAT